MYRSTGKPSVAKFRARLERIRECAASGSKLARTWNPKGRDFKVQRDMIRFFEEAARGATAYLEILSRR